MFLSLMVTNGSHDALEIGGQWFMTLHDVSTASIGEYSFLYLGFSFYTLRTMCMLSVGEGNLEPIGIVCDIDLCLKWFGLDIGNISCSLNFSKLSLLAGSFVNL